MAGAGAVYSSTGASPAIKTGVCVMHIALTLARRTPDGAGAAHEKAALAWCTHPLVQVQQSKLAFARCTSPLTLVRCTIDGAGVTRDVDGAGAVLHDHDWL